MATSNNEQPVVNAPNSRPTPQRPTFDNGAKLRARFKGAAKAIVGLTGTYNYQPIDIHNEIRILRVQHGAPADDLKCMLFPSALQLPHGKENPSKAGTFLYTALSYWWGDPDDEASNKITIYKDTKARGDKQTFNEFNKAKTVYIRDNLKAALLSFRNSETDVNVWVDALCINQKDMTEKNAQVARMHEVYTQATRVCVWLGEGDESTENTFNILERMLDLSHLDRLVVNETEAAESWAMVVKLMTNRWFSRRWVVQELALSREAFVRWGKRTLLWTDFADAIALFMTRYEEIKRSLGADYHAYKATEAQALGANVIVHATVNLFRKSHGGRIEQRLVPLEILVSSLLLPFEATEPRDTIFAVLMLANDDQLSSTNVNGITDRRIAPDYDKPLLDVYADFIDYCIDQSKSLDIICRYWAAVPARRQLEVLKRGNTVVEKMPSWIPLIKNSAYGEPRYLVEGRANGDSFVGAPERKGQQTYNASASLRSWHEFGIHDSSPKMKKGFTFPRNKQSRPSSSAGQPRPAAHAASHSSPETVTQASSKIPRYNGALRLRGFCLDIVSLVSARVSSGVITSDALELAGWEHHEDPYITQPVPDQLWRTLVADRGPDGRSAPPWYNRTCEDCLQRTDRQGDLNIPDLRKQPGTTRTHLAFLERVQSVVWNRRFFLTKGAQSNGKTPSKVQNGGAIPRPAAKLQSRKSLLGLGCPSVKENDLVCILFGCSVPVVLRKAQKDSETYYEFIGECYVHGMMGGEAITGKQPVHPYSALEYTTFELR